MISTLKGIRMPKKFSDVSKEVCQQITTIKILSIDLPWSANNYTGATYFELTLASNTYTLTEFRAAIIKMNRENPEYAETIKKELKIQNDKIDYILLDMPIKGHTYEIEDKKTFRPVELALTNFSSFKIKDKILCFPTFMAGANLMPKTKNVICDVGFETAKILLDSIGSTKCSVIEVFPQTTIPLIYHRFETEMSFMQKLAPHKKQKKENGHIRLHKVLSKILNKEVVYKADMIHGLPDLCDSIMGALPMLDLLTGGSFLKMPTAWLLYSPLNNSKHPLLETNKEERKRLRKDWIEGAKIDQLIPGPIQKGILCYGYDWI